MISDLVMVKKKSWPFIHVVYFSGQGTLHYLKKIFIHLHMLN